LTDVLLALIAARNPAAAAQETIRVVEGPEVSTPDRYCDTREASQREHCRTIWRDLDLGRASAPGSETCENEDLHLILGSAFQPADRLPAHVFLRCFQRQIVNALSSNPSDPTSSPSGAGIIRSLVANFLFNYKMSQQFPHEFKAYDLSQSADGLNSAFNPLIDAFNRDVTTFQRYVRAEVVYEVERLNREYDGRCCAKRLFGLDKPSFFNEGIVTVRTISGQWTYAATTSQSFLNVSAAPQLTDVANSLAGSGRSAGSG
jgi:hypothetical protein